MHRLPYFSVAQLFRHGSGSNKAGLHCYKLTVDKLFINHDSGAEVFFMNTDFGRLLCVKLDDSDFPFKNPNHTALFLCYTHGPEDFKIWNHWSEIPSRIDNTWAFLVYTTEYLAIDQVEMTSRTALEEHYRRAS